MGIRGETEMTPETGQIAEQIINDFPTFYMNALISGLWDAAKMLAPIFAPWFGLIMAYYIIRIIIKQHKKKKGK